MEDEQKEALRRLAKYVTEPYLASVCFKIEKARLILNLIDPSHLIEAGIVYKASDPWPPKNFPPKRTVYTSDAEEYLNNGGPEP